jgi:hypothetical protein
MLGHIGFSYVGLIYLLLLTIPNVIWIWNKPSGYDPSGENKLLCAFERIGMVGCTATVLFFCDYNPQTLEPWTTWLFASIGLMIMYEIQWIRYFRSNRTLRDFYGKFLFVPVPGATLPVAAFFLLAIYGKVIWLAISAIVVGIGHIGIHVQHLKRL